MFLFSSCTESKQQLSNFEKLRPDAKIWVSEQQKPQLIKQRINKLDSTTFKKLCNQLYWRLDLQNDILKAVNETNESLGYKAIEMRSNF